MVHTRLQALHFLSVPGGRKAVPNFSMHQTCRKNYKQTSSTVVDVYTEGVVNIVSIAVNNVEMIRAQSLLFKLVSANV